MLNLNIQLAGDPVDYDILIQKGILDQLISEIKLVHQGQRVFIISDETVNELYGNKVLNQFKEADYSVKSYIVPPGESSKHIQHVSDIYKEMVDFNLSRSDLLIALGGGVIGDLAGFIAATYLRGIPYIQIPTTLLAQVDSSVGGKVAVDLDEGKNLVGAFYHPKKVIIDPLVLNTLTDSDFSDGMAEVIKYGAIFDKELFDFIATHASREAMMEDIERIIYRSCELKAIVVRADERDTGERMLLNFGHTLGHAIEAFYNYKTYTHGQGVSIGMVTITQLAEEKGLTPNGLAKQIADVCVAFNLPTQLKNPNDYNQLISLVATDKKYLSGQLHVILLRQLGEAYIHPTDSRFFNNLIEEGR